MCDRLVSVKPFTCSDFDLAAGMAEQVYTSDDAVYSLTGFKGIVPNRWTKIVLDDRKPLLARSVVELRDIIPDCETIEGQGLGAAIRMPVYLSNKLLGTINLLDEND